MINKNKTAENHVDIIISGLGPTGLVLAHMLGMRGHSVVVLEREPTFYGNARAVYTDDECMRVFQHINAAEPIQEKMLQEAPVQFVGPDCKPLGQYFPLKQPFGWPVVNFFYQPYLETTLSDLLKRYPNVEIRRGREMTDFEQSADRVVVTHQATRHYRFNDASDAQSDADVDPDPRVLSGDYLVGADGGRSLVREKLGIKMTGRNFPEPWLVVDLEMKGGEQALRHLPYFNFVIDPEMPVVSCIQPDGFHRFEFMLKPGQTKEHMEKPETVRHYISKFVDPDRFEVKRKLVYTFNALIAERWREGRVFLAGDAAHMTPQFMGQGASSGIRDAYNLGWKLSAVLKGLADKKLLDTYGIERHDHAKAMIDVSVFLKDIVSMRHPVGTRLRNLFLWGSQRIPALKQWFQKGGFKPSPNYKEGKYFGLPRERRSAPEGSLSPQPLVRLLNGKRLLLDDLLGSEFSIVGLGVDPREHLSKQSLKALEELDCRYVTLFPYAGRPQGLEGVCRESRNDLHEVEDLNGQMIDWFRKAGFRSKATAILRPDKFTYAVTEATALEPAVITLLETLNGAGLRGTSHRNTSAGLGAPA